MLSVLNEAVLWRVTPPCELSSRTFYLSCHFDVDIDLDFGQHQTQKTVCKLRNLHEAHQLGDQLFTMIATCLQECDMKISSGTFVDAPYISTPRLIKNQDKARYPEMFQIIRCFVMEAHIGVDSRTKLIHSVVATAANVHDSQVLSDLLHADEATVWGDSANTDNTG